MSIAQRLWLEFEGEARTTRRVLERVPGDRLDWHAHPTAMSLGQLALHVGQTPGAVAQMVQMDAVELPNFQQPAATSVEEILAAHDASVQAFGEMLRTMPDDRIMAPWSMARGGTVLATMPRVALLRSVGMNHVYHHRGQLTLCLRMLEVPVPAVYGVSRDENPFA